MKRYRIHRLQRGQALVEFIVAALFFIVPLSLAVVVIGKLTDVRHTAQMAARYGAWERTVWYDDAGTQFGTINDSNRKSAAQINSEIAMRLVTDRTANRRLLDTDRNAASFANGTDPMWRDNGGVALLADYQQQASSITRERPRSDFTGQVMSVLSAVPGLSPVPPVPSDTLAIADVSWNRIAANSQSIRRLWPQSVIPGQQGQQQGQWQGFDFTATGAILSNTWGANGSVATTAMIKPSVPTSGAMGTLIRGEFEMGARLWDPGLRAPEIGKIAPDVVPEDRLRNSQR